MDRTINLPAVAMAPFRRSMTAWTFNGSLPVATDMKDQSSAPEMLLEFRRHEEIGGERNGADLHRVAL